MADVSSLSMVSSYNSLAMYRQQQQQQQTASQQSLAQQQQQHHSQHSQGQQHPVAGVNDGQQYWYGYPYTHHAAHHQSSGPQQYLEATDVIWPPHPHPAHPHYSHHLQYQHHPAAAAAAASYQQHQQHHQSHNPTIPGFSEWSSPEDNKNGIGAGEPSPPITVSGSEISSPGTPATPPANNNNNNSNNNNVTTTPIRPSQIRSPFEWMKKPSYQSQPNPACSVAAPTPSPLSAPHELCSLDVIGKTRTKDKYRVVYTDHQRLELEKEFHYSRYITIRRKAELAANLALSERQVKIWFQNRRAKERKQTKKREELDQKDLKPEGLAGSNGMAGLAALGGMGGMLGGLTSLSLAPPPPLHPHPHPGHHHSHGHGHPHPHTVLGL